MADKQNRIKYLYNVSITMNNDDWKDKIVFYLN